jgi:hypothetical protein
MTADKIKSCCLAVLLQLGFQSLADVAREEAERRRRLDEQGVEARVIEEVSAGSAENGNISTFTAPEKKAKKAPDEFPAPKAKPLRSFRTALQKLDQAIRQSETRLEVQRKRLQIEMRKPTDGKENKAQEKIRQEIENLEIKLKQLRQERSQTYAEGRKAGHLPGELDGKGIIP